jgi:hypothetical protein
VSKLSAIPSQVDNNEIADYFRTVTEPTEEFSLIEADSSQLVGHRSRTLTQP